MRHLLWTLYMCVAVLPAGAYEVGTANRTNFGAGQPQAQPTNYRSFSNYNNRSWGQGVQTDGVQTEGVQTQTVQTVTAGKEKPAAAVAKKQVNASSGAQPAVAPTQASSAPAAQATTPQKTGQVPPDAAVMMQQVQGMMNMVNNMTGQSGAPAGMPDMSALMGGGNPANATGAAPKK